MAWMLQGNPARFALRAYLQSPVIYWLVNRYQAEFALADHLFVWDKVSICDKNRNNSVTDIVS